MERDYKDFVRKSWNIGSHIKDGLLGYTFQARLFVNKLLSS